MWLSQEDARSDFVLAAAALLFGGLLVGLLVALPIYPRGLLGSLLLPVWVLLTSAYPAWWLVRYREQGMEGHGLPAAGRDGLAQGAALALPVLVAGYVQNFAPYGPVEALLGRAADLLTGPAVAPLDVLSLLVNLLVLLAVGVSGVLLYGMLTVRARDAFRSPDIPVLEALRTYGMGSAGIGLLMGLLVLVDGRRSLLGVALDVGTLVVLVLMTDRLVVTSDRTTRATILAPAIVVVVSALLASGGLFRGDLLGTLYFGSLGAGLAVVVASLIETRRSSWAIVPLVAASVWAPTCVTLPTLLRLCP